MAQMNQMIHIQDSRLLMTRGPMLRSIATVSISGTLPEKLHAIAAAGYQGVEIFENDLLYYTGTPADIRNLAADLGLKITLFNPFAILKVPAAASLRRIWRGRSANSP